MRITAATRAAGARSVQLLTSASLPLSIDQHGALRCASRVNGKRCSICWRRAYVEPTQASEVCSHMLDKRLDDRLVALEKHPLTDPLRRHEAGALQSGQVRRHGRLRQSAACADLAGAHAVVGHWVVIGEVLIRLS